MTRNLVLLILVALAKATRQLCRIDFYPLGDSRQALTHAI